MNPGAIGVSRRPSRVQSFPLPKYARAKACRDYFQLLTKVWPGGQNISIDGVPTWSQAYVFSDETPAGFYRWLVALSASDNNASSIHAIDFHIVPPMARTYIREFQGVAPFVNYGYATSMFVCGSFFRGTGGTPNFHQGGAYAPTVASVKISPNDITHNTAQNSSLNTQVAQVGCLPLAVPEGWRILAWQDNNSTGEAGQSLTLRMAYYELPLGFRPPTVSRQLQ
jgi:hypothetical protein